jgi:hypothetical protein
MMPTCTMGEAWHGFTYYQGAVVMWGEQGMRDHVQAPFFSSAAAVELE